MTSKMTADSNEPGRRISRIGKELTCPYCLVTRRRRQESCYGITERLSPNRLTLETSDIENRFCHIFEGVKSGGHKVCDGIAMRRKCRTYRCDELSISVLISGR